MRRASEVRIMMKYADNEKWIRNEYVQAHFNPESGLDAAALESKVRTFFENSAGMSSVMQRARSFEIIMREAQIEVNPHTLFADKINLGIRYGVWAGPSFYERIYVERYDRIFSERIPKKWAQRQFAKKAGISIPDTDFWHTCPDWNDVMRLGIPGLRKRLAEARNAKEKEGALDAETAEFYDASLLCYDSILAYMDRLYKEAVRVGNREFAECIGALSEHEPRTLYQAMELSLFYMTVEEIGRERCRSLGNLDNLFFPFYKEALESGALDREEIKDLFRFYFTKINAGKRYADQPICFGGYDGKGETAVSEMTELALDVYAELVISNPKLHIRYNEKFPDKILLKLMGMIREGNNSIVILNDATIIKAYGKIGVPAEIAARYLPLGCYEPAIPGYEDARICGSWINLAKAVELAVHGGIDSNSGEYFMLHTDPEPPTFEDFYKIYLEHLKSFVDFTMDSINSQVRFSYEINPHPVYSATLKDCVENGKDIFNNGMNVRNSSIKVFAIGTAVDSLLAVKHYVYEEKEIGLSALSDLLKNNWKGGEILRMKILKDTRKWGNNIAEADELARDIYKHMEKWIVNVPNGNGGVYRMGADSVNFAEEYGHGTGATPDGRLNGMPLSKNMRPVNGMERNGLTAFLSSALQIDQTAFVDGAPLDIMLHPSAVEGEKGIKMLAATIKEYFRRGGVSVQCNIVGAEILMAAQKNPELYPNLQIRVCGWNEYFVNMSKVVQQDFIDRAKGL